MQNTIAITTRTGPKHPGKIDPVVGHRDSVMTFKFSRAEREEIERKAAKYFGGSLSELVREAIKQYKPEGELQ